MKDFPDESRMERSADGSEAIRGGSIGLNRILGYFVLHAGTDRKPAFNAFILSAFTFFRNVWEMIPEGNAAQLEQAFVHDIQLFLDYYDTYLGFTRNGLVRSGISPVLIYFPNYKAVPKERWRTFTGRKAMLMDRWTAFLKKHGSDSGVGQTLENCRSYWMPAGGSTYPHRDVVNRFRDFAGHPQSLYANGDPIGLITHIPLDFYIGARLRNVQLLQSYQGDVKAPSVAGMKKIDKESRVPFVPVTHVVLGDEDMFQPWATGKERKALFEAAEKDRWVGRQQSDLLTRVSAVTHIPVSQLRAFDFI